HAHVRRVLDEKVGGVDPRELHPAEEHHQKRDERDDELGKDRAARPVVELALLCVRATRAHRPPATKVTRRPTKIAGANGIHEASGSSTTSCSAVDLRRSAPAKIARTDASTFRSRPLRHTKIGATTNATVNA